MVEAARLLTRYLERSGLTKAEAARRLGTSSSALHYWVHGGQRPRADMRQRIARWSEGLVPADAWLSPEERMAIETVGKRGEVAPCSP